MGAMFALFMVIPILELVIFIWIQGRIGLGWTLVGILITAMIGASLARAQGFKVWQSFTQEAAAGRVPGREIAHGAMVLFGAALLLTPGYLTDTVGFLLMVPGVREVVRARGAKFITNRAVIIR